MKIAIDFDGTICKRNGIPTLPGFGEPMEGALDSIRLLVSLGHEVYILTSNPSLSSVHTWLEQHHFPELRITNIKEPSTVYIDDRAIRFENNWNSIRKYFF